MEVIHDHRVLNHQIDDPLLCADLLSVVLPSINARIKLFTGIPEHPGAIFFNCGKVSERLASKQVGELPNPSFFMSRFRSRSSHQQLAVK